MVKHIFIFSYYPFYVLRKILEFLPVVTRNAIYILVLEI